MEGRSIDLLTLAQSVLEIKPQDINLGGEEMLQRRSELLKLSNFEFVYPGPFEDLFSSALNQTQTNFFVAEAKVLNEVCENIRQVDHLNSLH